MTSSGDFPGPNTAEPSGEPEGTDQPLSATPVDVDTSVPTAPDSPGETSVTSIDLGGTGQLGGAWEAGLPTMTSGIEAEGSDNQMTDEPGAALESPVGGDAELTTAPAPWSSAPSLDPEVAAIVEIPAQTGSNPEASGEGGEWELLVGQIREWMNTVQLQQSLQEARRPLILLGLLLALLLVLRLYSAVLSTLDHLPLLPGLLELVGVITVTRFSLTNLVRSQQRQALVQTILRRWKAFKG